MAAPCPSEVAFLTSATCVVMPTSSRCRGSAFGLKAWILQVLPPSWRTSDSGDESRLDPSPVEPCRVCLEGGGTNRQLHLKFLGSITGGGGRHGCGGSNRGPEGEVVLAFRVVEVVVVASSERKILRGSSTRFWFPSFTAR